MPNYRSVAIGPRDKLDRLLFGMINLFGFIIFVCSACIVFASAREFGHPFFRTLTAHDYGEGVGQIFAITEDPQGRILFRCEEAILVFDNNRWETIAAPGTVFIRSFAADTDGVVWFSNSIQIGCLSRVDGGYRRVKVYEGSLGVNSGVIVDRDRLYFTSESGLLTWDNEHMSQQPWAYGVYVLVLKAAEDAPESPDPVSLAAPSPQIRNYEGQRRKILVVDDEPLNRSMLRELLSTVGLEAAEADSPEKAFSLIKKGFDAVISDIRMPGYDRHTFGRNLRSSAETKDLIIIACSRSVFADDQRLALDSGFSDFLAKPVMEEELFGVLGRHLKLRWKYKEVRPLQQQTYDL
jgi:CheY-like chemotaxis protein